MLIRREICGSSYLNAGSICHGNGCKHEANEDTSDRTELDSNPAETGVDNQIHDRDENDQSDRIDVLQEIVGDPMIIHNRGLGDEIIEHLIVADPVDREEDEDSASNQCATDFINEEIVPVGLVFVATNAFLVRGLSSVEIAFIYQTDPHDLEGIENNGATRRARDISLSADDQDEDGEEEDAERKEISSPETDIGLELSRGHTGETPNVDRPIEPSVHSLDSDCGIDDHSLAALCDFDIFLCILVLFNDKSRDIGFDSTSPDSDNDHRRNQASEVGRGVGLGDRRRNENELTDEIDEGEHHDSTITPKELVCHNRSQDWRDITLVCISR